MLTYITIATIFAAVGYLVGAMIAARRHIKAGKQAGTFYFLLPDERGSR